MKSNFLVIGLSINVFFTYVSINGMQPSPKPSRELVRTWSLPFQGKTNSIVETIIKKEWNNEPEYNKQIQRYLLELAEWHAHEISKNEQDEQIYKSALRKFGKTNPIRIERKLPQLKDPLTKIPVIENPELKNLMSEINANIRTITINNFNVDITSNNKKIDAILETKGTIKDYEYEHELQKAIAKQLKTIQNKMDFTQDQNELRIDLDKLLRYEKGMSEANLNILKKLEERLINNIPSRESQPDVPNPKPKTTIDEPAIKKPSKADTEESPQQEAQNLEQTIQPFPVAQLLKTFETKGASVVQKGQKPSLSSSSSTSLSSISLKSPEKMETLSTETIQKPTPEVIPPVNPSQATEEEQDGPETSSTIITPISPAKTVNNQVVDTLQKTKKIDASQPLTLVIPLSEQHQAPETKDILQETSTQPSRSSSFWDFSWLKEKISAFFDRFFWAIYGYR